MTHRDSLVRLRQELIDGGDFRHVWREAPLERGRADILAVSDTEVLIAEVKCDLPLRAIGQLHFYGAQEHGEWDERRIRLVLVVPPGVDPLVRVACTRAHVEIWERDYVVALQQAVAA